MTNLSLRELNRTLLVRQMLVERVELTPFELVRHLVAVQGQEPNWPYVGLWARLNGFRHDHLAALLRSVTINIAEEWIGAPTTQAQHETCASSRGIRSRPRTRPRCAPRRSICWASSRRRTDGKVVIDA